MMSDLPTDHSNSTIKHNEEKPFNRRQQLILFTYSTDFPV